MKQTWRWFGPADKIAVSSLRQAGVEGIVTALHHVPTGDVWSCEEIKLRQQQINKPEGGVSSGLEWDVVESLPVSESIKLQQGDWQQHIENYKLSLENLSSCGLQTVCYNFMPVLDWTRTDLRSTLSHGGNAMRFDLVEFAGFDIYILEREQAADDYPQELVEMAHRHIASLDERQRDSLQHNIVAGLPGANDEWTLSDIRKLLSDYQGLSRTQLQANLVDFLKAVIPTAEKQGIRLCCHPDDPPFSILGLPRIMSSEADYTFIMEAVDSGNNGVTLCTGSLGVSPTMDFVSFIQQWGSRIHFAHLRNTKRDGYSFDNKFSFFEDAHLEGDTNMVAVIDALLNEEKNRRNLGRKDWQIPMRPDHGQELLDDLERNSMPGYPLIGRMRGLAELRGVVAALS